MANSHLLLLLLLLTFSLLSVHHSAATQSESESLLKIQQLLNHPPPLARFNSTDTHSLCSIEPTPSLTLYCYQGNVTQLHISGGGAGAAFPPLPLDFSTNSLFSALAAAFPTLKVLSLVSLQLWGPLPPSIARLSSLEILNLNSNYLSGAIPPHISSLVNLQTLILDRNNFTGRLPASLGSLPSLAVLSLNHNLLNGPLPSSLASLQTLRVLSLSHNFMSGQVPDLTALTNMQLLDLEANSFGPHFPSLPYNNKLVTLVLRNNTFRVGIQTGFQGGFQLQKLDISLNEFVGPFSPSWLSLPSINYLDIAGNKFTGVLSKNISCNAELAFVNLSSNLLGGNLPTCLKNRGSKNNSAVVLYSGNCLTNVDQQQRSNLCHNEALAVELPPSGDRKIKRRHDNKQIVASSAVGGIVGAAAVVLLAFMAVKRLLHGEQPVKSPRTRLIRDSASTVNTAKLLSDAKYISETMKLGASLPAYRTFALEELKEATNDFDDSTLLGEGAHGQRQMYRGKLPDGTLVAIKGLKMRKRQATHVYTHLLELVSKLRHSHLVSALGHCLEYNPDDSGVSRIFLVFEFVPNGTLRGFISEGPPERKFTWAQRIVAAIGVAKGVQFLHTGIVPGVKSNNLKITNVLLDHDLHVKISSYNLPLLAENNRGTVGTAVSSPAPKGSIHTRVNHECKNDVYDIGVILLEMILGRPIMFPNEVGVLKDLVRVSLTIDDTARRSIVDAAVHKECSDKSLKTMMEICVRCLTNDAADRPSVEDILWNLQFAAQVQESAREDCRSSSQGSPVSSP
ncbi:inactive leucine-rich repeat receptor-like protein kinase [Pyrus ussuriensis x Pyrus communis]|uniref:Inactive leucine-rich repeat receptor-like protein kinase n=1 Tax=Pyrus ussuriensis x Pyrus communis TaxID=2448454 RepID=A0A5N5I909_9ROSA|nr:inactive leucine-rich repeat receptor-like protein kinase [Pyrus ussuriensis x Pyrus communis]